MNILIVIKNSFKIHSFHRPQRGLVFWYHVTMKDDNNKFNYSQKSKEKIEKVVELLKKLFKKEDEFFTKFQKTQQ